MKRVKIMLTAIAVLAVVGGALAFKAKKFTSTIYCSDNTTTFCKVPVFGFTTTTDVAPQRNCSINQLQTDCPLISTKGDE
jgi:hypothetical protein